MNEKKNDLNNITRGKLSDKVEGINIDSFYVDDVGLKYLALKVSLIYAIIGGLWILFSDRILYELIESKEAMLKIQSIKGWVYVLISSLALYVLISEYMKKK